VKWGLGDSYAIVPLCEGDWSCRFGSLSAKGTRRARLGSIVSGLETRSWASRQKATEMHHLN
jgi:hypothetical protein